MGIVLCRSLRLPRIRFRRDNRVPCTSKYTSSNNITKKVGALRNTTGTSSTSLPSSRCRIEMSCTDYLTRGASPYMMTRSLCSQASSLSKTSSSCRTTLRRATEAPMSVAYPRMGDQTGKFWAWTRVSRSTWAQWTTSSRRPSCTISTASRWKDWKPRPISTIPSVSWMLWCSSRV